MNTGLIFDSEAEMNSFGLDLTAHHKDNLIPNLSGLDLDFDAVDRDGDCFFRAIARQLCKHDEPLQGTNSLTLFFTWIR